MKSAFSLRCFLSTRFLIIIISIACCMFGALLPAEAQTLRCGQETPVSTSDNHYTVENNEFDGHGARECISISGTNFKVTESAISNPPDEVAAYPSIYLGCHWGSCTDATFSNLPRRPNDISSIISTWQVDYSRVLSSDSYDVAYDIWFNKDQAVQATPPQSGQPNGAELMIWLNSKNTTPAGSPPIKSNIAVGDGVYDIYKTQLCDKNTGVCWTYIAYVLTLSNGPSITSTGTSNLHIEQIINDAIQRQYLDPSFYLISTEAGFELWRGGANLETISFSANITPGTATGTLNIWWPTEGAVLSGTQPFKARLENVSLSSYNMYWAVDGGQLNLMSDNTAGGDHKEASVDLSGWTWRDAGDKWGPFSVNFIAKDLSGTVLQQKAVNIYVAKSLSIWWPTDGSVLSGTQPFKARLDNVSLSSYNMYWSVDGGQLNFMGDNTVGGDHKEASVDLTGWTWRDNGSNYGPFSVTFTAQDLSGATVKTKAVTIYRAK